MLGKLRHLEPRPDTSFGSIGSSSADVLLYFPFSVSIRVKKICRMIIIVQNGGESIRSMEVV